MSWQKSITVDASVCYGMACVTGTRIKVSAILDSLAAGLEPDEILLSYPSLSGEAIRAAMAYAELPALRPAC